MNKNNQAWTSNPRQDIEWTEGKPQLNGSDPMDAAEPYGRRVSFAHFGCYQSKENRER